MLNHSNSSSDVYLLLVYCDVAMEKKQEKYTILLPTYNERENLPIVTWLIVKYMTERLVKYTYDKMRRIVRRASSRCLHVYSNLVSSHT